MSASGASVPVAVGPGAEEAILDAARQGGGELVEAREAEALVWTDASDPEALGATLRSSPAKWVQLPFAGIEKFVAAGVIDPGLTWTCAKGIYGPSCAEHAVALMLAVSRGLPTYLTARSWKPRDEDRRLKEATVVVVGTGGIGRALAEMLGPFGSHVIGVNRSGGDLPGADETHQSSSLALLLPRADYVVVAAPLTDDTRGMFNASMLAHMRDEAWIVNVARGALIDTDDLVSALEADSIGGAALDVTEPEPLPDGHPLWELPNAIVTPHVANTWRMALPELADLVRRNVAHFAAGEELEGLVDPSAGY